MNGTFKQLQIDQNRLLMFMRTLAVGKSIPIGFGFIIYDYYYFSLENKCCSCHNFQCNVDEIVVETHKNQNKLRHNTPIETLEIDIITPKLIWYKILACQKNIQIKIDHENPENCEKQQLSTSIKYYLPILLTGPDGRPVTC